MQFNQNDGFINRQELSSAVSEGFPFGAFNIDFDDIRFSIAAYQVIESKSSYFMEIIALAMVSGKVLQLSEVSTGITLPAGFKNDGSCLTSNCCLDDVPLIKMVDAFKFFHVQAIIPVGINGDALASSPNLFPGQKTIEACVGSNIEERHSRFQE